MSYIPTIDEYRTNDNLLNLIKVLDDSYNNIEKSIHKIILDETYGEFDSAIFDMYEYLDESFNKLNEFTLIISDNYKLGVEINTDS